MSEQEIDKLIQENVILEDKLNKALETLAARTSRLQNLQTVLKSIPSKDISLMSLNGMIKTIFAILISSRDIRMSYQQIKEVYMNSRNEKHIQMFRAHIQPLIEEMIAAVEADEKQAIKELRR